MTPPPSYRPADPRRPARQLRDLPGAGPRRRRRSSCYNYDATLYVSLVIIHMKYTGGVIMTLFSTPRSAQCWRRVATRCSGCRTTRSFCRSTVRARPGRRSGLGVSHGKSVFYGAFVWACRALNSRRRFPGRGRDLLGMPDGGGAPAGVRAGGGGAGGDLARVGLEGSVALSLCYDRSPTSY